ncbi:MAG: hypothetical protein J6X54_04145 [Treponema sp.]|nr:hypothetical protein [Treponema sp.]
MKKKLFALITALTLSNFLFALDFKITGYTGLSFGTIEEELYASKARYLVSYLEWEEKPLVDLGAIFQVNHSLFFANLNVTTALPLNCGNMYDSDYDSSKQYLYSINQNKAGLNLQGDFFTGIKALTVDDFTLSPVIGLSLYYKNFTASNGYSWNGSENKTGITGNVPWDSPQAVFVPQGKLSDVEITMKNLTAWLGFSFEYKFLENFYCSFGAFVSPYAYTWFLDDHKDNFVEAHGKSHAHQTMTETENFFTDFLLEFKAAWNFLPDQVLSLCVKYYVDNNDKSVTWVNGYINKDSTALEFIPIGQPSQIRFSKFSVYVGYSYLF